MKRGIILVATLLFVACGDVDAGDNDAALTPEPDASGEHRQDDKRDGDEEDEEPECACELAGPCCGGCDAIHVGDACDDGLECTSSSTCQDDGVCRGTSDACNHLIIEPQCQAVSCDDSAGCGAVENVREGFACDDGDASTYDDRCASGACVGTPCECTGESECCDGCLAINEGSICSSPTAGTFGDAICALGACVGECECDAGSGPCCDGCHFIAAGTRCQWSVASTIECVNRDFYRFSWAHLVCTGASHTCEDLVWDEPQTERCPLGLE